MKSVLLIILVCTLALLNGCKKDVHSQNVPYYKFTKEDKTKLLASYSTGKKLVYKNQDNTEISFVVKSSEINKTPYSTGTFSGSEVQTHFYYDQQAVVSQYIEGNDVSNCEVTVQRYPIGSNYLTDDPVEGTPTLIGFLRFPLWNIYNDSLGLDNSIFIDFNTPVTSLSINGKTYSNVRIFESGSTQILDPNLTSLLLPKNVNKIYYDQNAGVIGFDDINGKMWRLQ